LGRELERNFEGGEKAQRRGDGGPLGSGGGIFCINSARENTWGEKANKRSLGWGGKKRSSRIEKRGRKRVRGTPTSRIRKKNAKEISRGR